MDVIIIPGGMSPLLRQGLGGASKPRMLLDADFVQQALEHKAFWAAEYNQSLGTSLLLTGWRPSPLSPTVMALAARSRQEGAPSGTSAQSTRTAQQGLQQQQERHQMGAQRQDPLGKSPLLRSAWAKARGLLTWRCTRPAGPTPESGPSQQRHGGGSSAAAAGGPAAGGGPPSSSPYTTSEDVPPGPLPSLALGPSASQQDHPHNQQQQLQQQQGQAPLMLPPPSASSSGHQADGGHGFARFRPSLPPTSHELQGVQALHQRAAEAQEGRPQLACSQLGGGRPVEGSDPSSDPGRCYVLRVDAEATLPLGPSCMVTASGHMPAGRSPGDLHAVEQLTQLRCRSSRGPTQTSKPHLTHWLGALHKRRRRRCSPLGRRTAGRPARRHPRSKRGRHPPQRARGA